MCGLRSETPTQYLRIFSLKKKNIKIKNKKQNKKFCKLRPICKGFSASKTANFTNFCSLGPSSKDFLTKMGPMSTGFWWKSNPFGRHTCLNMWVSPGVNFIQSIQILTALRGTVKIIGPRWCQNHDYARSEAEGIVMVLTSPRAYNFKLCPDQGSKLTFLPTRKLLQVPLRSTR